MHGDLDSRILMTFWMTLYSCMQWLWKGVPGSHLWSSAFSWGSSCESSIHGHQWLKHRYQVWKYRRYFTTMIFVHYGAPYRRGLCGKHACTDPSDILQDGALKIWIVDITIPSLLYYGCIEDCSWSFWRYACLNIQTTVMDYLCFKDTQGMLGDQTEESIISIKPSYKQNYAHSLPRAWFFVLHDIAPCACVRSRAGGGVMRTSSAYWFTKVISDPIWLFLL